MTGASKILTVSYGTFSCTLEGFEDPFNTMKAIAEYFRDLAAEDRYFGAEPPTPDAAMLHRIAEREIQRRVEAKIQENGVLLRAADGQSADAAPLPKISFPASEDPAPIAAPTLAPAVADAAVDSGDLTVAPALAPATEMAESVAAKLSRLRAEAARDAEAQAAAVQTLTLATASVEQDQPQADSTDALLAGLIADLAPAPANDAPEAVAPETADAAIDLSGIIETTEPETQSFEDSISAALDFAAPVSIEEVEAPQDTAIGSIFAMDEEAVEDDLAASDAEFAQSFAGVEPEAEAEAELGFMESATPAAESDDLTDQVFPAEQTDATEAQPATVAEEQPQAELRSEAAEKLQRARARVIRIRRADPAAEAAMDAQPDALPEAIAEAVAEIAPLAAPVAELDLTAPSPAVAAPASEAPLLSPEEEADLEAELAALRAEVAPQDPPAAAISPAPAPFGSNVNAFEADELDEDEEPGAESRAAFADQGADDAVSRLMAQADQEMEGPENKRRLSAIAHLKAAVAATVAERKASGEQPAPEASRLARYRDDLALVVRSKLGVGPAQTMDPNLPRPAPLVLVSEQRIDKPASPAATPRAPIAAVPDQPRPVQPAAAPAPAAAVAAMPEQAAPIRPRRVIASEAVIEDEEDEAESTDNALVDVRGFTEFAERLGAKTLPQLIEASAAYLAVVQKREAFSRPQLMANVEAALPGELPREDGLRSFGALLRTGRLTKLRRGQFVLADSSTYLDEGKRIAG